MSDHFFNTPTCDRCGGTLEGGRTQSYFSEEALCLRCSKLEHAHPLFQEALRAERAAVERGDRGFPGIGCPADLKESSIQARRAAESSSQGEA